MRPLLRPGDRLLVRPAWRGRVRPGELVVVRDPRQHRRRMVKRLAHRDGARAWVLGDNAAASTDSRAFGWVRLPPVVARPVRCYAPPGRAGPLPAGPAEPTGRWPPAPPWGPRPGDSAMERQR